MCIEKRTNTEGVCTFVLDMLYFRQFINKYEILVSLANNLNTKSMLLVFYNFIFRLKKKIFFILVIDRYQSS